MQLYCAARLHKLLLTFSPFNHSPFFPLTHPPGPADQLALLLPPPPPACASAPANKRARPTHTLPAVGRPDVHAGRWATLRSLPVTARTRPSHREHAQIN